VAAAVDGAPGDVPIERVPIPPTGRDLFPLAEGSLTAVVTALREADPDMGVTSWAGTVPTMWWSRRLAHETAVHRVDAQLAASPDDPPTPIDAALAGDGIDELFELFVPLRIAAHPVEPPLTAHLHATDAEGEWLVKLGTGVELTHEHAKGDVAMRGAASALLLTLWNRTPHQEVETFAASDDQVDALMEVLRV
jgi:hypothetical protein